MIFIITAVGICSYAIRDETKSADAAIILGAGVSGGEPSPVFQERINHGIWLYQNGYVDKLLFTGGFSGGSIKSDADIAREFAAQQGIPPEAMLLEEQSGITQENLYYAKLVMEQNGLKDALIVSDPLHMKRAMIMAEDEGLEGYTSPTTSTKYQSIRTKAMFLARETVLLIGYQLYRIWN